MERPPGDGPVGVSRIALVHHNALLREGLCRVLATGGFQVVWQGEERIGLLDGVHGCCPDLILLAWEAPGVDVSLIEQLAASPLRAPIVIMTQPQGHDDLGPALFAGAAGCLSANMETSEFLTALRMLTHGDIVVSHDMVPAVIGGTDPERLENRLTPRELQVLRALGRGATNQEIAEELHLSPHTVKIHTHHILRKMGFRDRQQAAIYAATEGVV